MFDSCFEMSKTLPPVSLPIVIIVVSIDNILGGWAEPGFLSK